MCLLTFEKQDFIGQASPQDWLRLLGLIDFINEQPNRPMVAELIASTLAGIRASTQGKVLTPLETMQLCFAKAGLAPSWDILCKTLILCNLAEIDHAAAVQQFLHQQNPAAVDNLIKALSSCKHTPEEYTHIFIGLFGQCCHVRTHVVHQALENRLLRKEKNKKHAQSVYHTHKKPSLTQILELTTGDGGGREDSFAYTCNALRLPSNASMLIKQAIYYMCVIGHTTEALLSTILSLTNETATTNEPNNKLQYPTIITPDLQTLKAFLADIQHVGAPCHTIRLFKDQCIPGGHNWSTILRLYLAVYCKPAAKELWRFAVQNAGGGLCTSTETEMATQRFVEDNPFDANMLIQLLLIATK